MIHIKKSQHLKGFTLIEIMVALLIGLFLAAGAAQIFLNTNKSNRLQENLSRMQENARFAMHFIREDVQRSGYFGGECLKSAGTVVNILDSADPAYLASLHEFKLPVSLLGAISGANASGPRGSDQITLRAFFALNTQLTSSAMASVTAPIQAKSNSGFQENDIILITDCTYANIFQVTNDPSANSDQLAHADGGEDSDIAKHIPGNKGAMSPVPLMKAYPKNSRLYKLSHGVGNVMQRTYRIAPSTILNIPSLFRNNEALIGDIENLQITYGVNTIPPSADLTLRQHNTPNYYTDDINSLSQTELENIRSITISLLVRSPDDNLVPSPQTYKFNNVDVTATDRRIRHVYTTTIIFRNRENYIAEII